MCKNLKLHFIRNAMESMGLNFKQAEKEWYACQNLATTREEDYYDLVQAVEKEGE